MGGSGPRKEKIWMTFSGRIKIMVSSTSLGSLWDVDDDTISGQVADERIKRGLLNIFAVLDSGAEGNALLANVAQRVPLKSGAFSKSG